MRSLTVAGWRFVPHSYSVVNMFQTCAIERAGWEVHHIDLPLFAHQWPVDPEICSPEMRSRIERWTPPDAVTDVGLRIAFPYQFTPFAPAPKNWVFITAEFSSVPTESVIGGRLSELVTERGMRVLTPSQWSKTGIVNSGVPENRVDVIPHGVDPGIFHQPLPDDPVRDNIRKGWGVSPEDPVFYTAGSATGNKNLTGIFNAFARVLEKRPGALLVVKGLNSVYSSEEMVKMWLQDLSVTDLNRVTDRLRCVFGTNSFWDVGVLHRAGDVYVAPYAGEGFCLPALEAVATGRPAVVTDGGATDDFITPEVGVKIPSTLYTIPLPAKAAPTELPQRVLITDPNDIASAMLTAADPGFRQRVAVQGPKMVQNGWTWDCIARKLINLFDSTTF